MDNPQHYQPLSHALQPPPLPQPSQYSTFPASNATQPYSVTDTQREEEEEEEEEVVEEELDDNDRRELSPSASPQNKQVVGCVNRVTLQLFPNPHFLTLFFGPEARPRRAILSRKSSPPRHPLAATASLLLIVPIHPNRSVVLVVLRVPETENPVRALPRLASPSSPATPSRKAAHHRYQASPHKINSTTNSNGGYSTCAPSSMEPQKSLSFVLCLSTNTSTFLSFHRKPPRL